MTAQVPDKYFYEGINYSMIAMSDDIGFEPKHYGLELVMASSACWRGYYVDYAIEGNQLLLKNIYLRESTSGYPTINNVFVSKIKDGFMFERMYKDVDMLMDYTGTIVIGKGFIDKYYIHMGFQRAWAYEEVLELLFANGVLMKVIDHSEKVKEIRDRVDAGMISAKEKDVSEYVRRSFSLSMEDKACWISDK